MFLKQCKYIQKENKVIKYIINDLESSSDDSDKNRLKLNIRIFFEAATLENVIFEITVLQMCFLRELF